MLTGFFEQDHSSQFENRFISNEKLFLDRGKSVYLFSCDYSVLAYQQEFFDLFSVAFPGDLARAVPKRQAEFLAGRYAAREAMRCSGIDANHPETVHVGPQRSPIWPSEYIGSITHTDNKAICVITSFNTDVQIGVDYETYLSELVACEVNSNIHTKEESLVLTEQGISTSIATTIIFSAKESLFKALYPKVGEYFGFDYATVRYCDVSSGCLTLRLKDSFANKYLIPDQYICDFELSPDGVLTLIHNQTG